MQWRVLKTTDDGYLVHRVLDADTDMAAPGQRARSAEMLTAVLKTCGASASDIQSALEELQTKDVVILPPH